MEEAQTLLAAAAGTVPARARFIARFIGTTTFSSVTVGAVLGQCGAMLPCGPLVPFFVGAHLGYTFGMIRFWQGEKARALKYVTMYPRLIEHALRTELGTYVSVPCAGALAEWLHDDGAGMFTSWGRQAWTILAAQSIIPQVDEIDSLARSSLVSTYVEATAVSDAS